MKQGITSLIFLFVLYPHKFLQAQVNLVLNPSFEDVVGCPEGQGTFMLDSAYYWYNPTQSTPDLFMSCTASGAFNHAPDNAWGYQLPNSGSNYAGFAAELEPVNASGREYLGGTLADTLVAGKMYVVELYLSQAFIYSCFYKSVGVFFSNIQLEYSTLEEIQVYPQVTFDTIIRDTVAWTKVSDTMTAHGGEKYFIIGLFTDNANTTIETLYYDSLNPSLLAYYFIDDVSVTLIEDSISPPPPRPPAFQLFPNPNNGVFSISGPFVVDDRIVVYDAVGRLIFSYHVTAENNLLQLFPQLATGVYVCRVERKDEVVFKRRVVVAD